MNYSHFKGISSIFLSSLISCLFLSCTPPDLVIYKLNQPKLYGNPDYQKYISYKNFMILITSPNLIYNQNGGTVYLDDSKSLEIYKYSEDKVSIIYNGIVSILKSYIPNAKIIDREKTDLILREKIFNLSGLTNKDLEEIKEIYAIDAIIECDINFIRYHLIYTKDSIGGWRYCYCPEVSLSIKCISTETAEIFINKTCHLDMLQFLPKEKLINECPSGDIDWLIGVTLFFSFQDLMSPEDVFLSECNYKYKMNGNKIEYSKAIKDFLLINPNSYRALGTLGWLYLTMGDIKQFIALTLKAYKMINQNNPRDMWIKVNYGHVNLVLNRIDAAEKIYREALFTSGSVEFADVLREDFKLLLDFDKYKTRVKVMYYKIFGEELN
ncbi:MAG: hypothetical protein JXA99_11500 [Candidatus Lokiarchaeota archaeon]|nr:hypothetical protein [Candidatus Lokiarchaeota archaeon]